MSGTLKGADADRLLADLERICPPGEARLRIEVARSALETLGVLDRLRNQRMMQLAVAVRQALEALSPKEGAPNVPQAVQVLRAAQVGAP